MQLTTSPQHLGSWTRSARVKAAAAVTVTLLFVFWLDRATDSAPVQHLYYIPIIGAGIWFDLAGGTLAALLAIVMYHVANPHLLTFRYGESDIVQIGLFVAVGVITARLTRDANRLRHLAATDDLTGLHNLRSFEAHLANLVRSARAERTPLALLVLDVDRLKSLNDRHGHLTGAEAVRAVGQLLGARLPPHAVACRYGGDEFAVVIPRATSYSARAIADDLRLAIRKTALVLAGQPFAAGAVTISVGVSSDDGPHRPWSMNDLDIAEALFREADAGLYRAKARGRNRVCVFVPPSPSFSSVSVVRSGRADAGAPQEVVVMSCDLRK